MVEHVVPADGPFRMTTFGASFHWTDRTRVGDAVFDITEPGGAILVLAPSDLLGGGSAWERTIKDVLSRHVGQQRRAGSGAYQQGERHAEALARTRFSDIQSVDLLVEERWSVEEILGYLKSTSYASLAVLGDATWGALEMDLRQSLQPMMPTAGFARVNEFTLIHGRRQP